ncbi:type II 3-dehydroquinate dehydratase [Algoriella sp.]|uniref:type II 3-dehydroquinate dehydratase n=1 Tax=Algoriella sp. TaxID=1872434 RepID=UPI001B29CDCF|nr:type II 3-dehydroquinate dehydratase [Algoriella sp.]MBO6212576.1 3-dehydroquinate dehydratase [Algoriella sp.]
MKQIQIINGPNLNLLGVREPEIYGNQTFEDFFIELKHQFPEVSLHYYQSNHEGDIIDKLHEVGFRYDGIVLNAAAYTHYSYAIADAIKAIKTPVIEVHISDIYAREDFRKISIIGESCLQIISGKGLPGYVEAIGKFVK